AALLYSLCLGGERDERVFAIAVDSEGTAYATGSTLSDDFPAVNPPLPKDIGHDAFIVKIIDPPCAANCARSANILLNQLQFGRFALTSGTVLVREENGNPVPGATVTATYNLPDTEQAVTNALGIARFRKIDFVPFGNPPQGKLLVTDIVKAGFTFDPAQSVLSKSTQ
ncbi:MAG: hypothetical protein ACE5JX_10145, partial [Acidobacteriota bacterium]